MKRNLFGLAAGVLLSGALVAAQGQAPGATPQSPRDPAPQPGQAAPQPTPQPGQATSPSAPAEITLTGCLIQGSGPTVFILENGKANASNRTDRGTSYVLMAAANVDLKDHVNHQVRIVGSSDALGASSTPAPRPEGSSETNPGAPSSSGNTVTPGASTPDSTVSGRVIGQPAQPAPSADAGIEREMPRFSAKSVTKVADTCSATS